MNLQTVFIQPIVKVMGAWLLASVLFACNSHAKDDRHAVSLAGGLDMTYSAQSVVVANRDPGSMEPTGHFNLNLRDPDDKKRQVQLALIDPSTPPSEHDLTRQGWSTTQDGIQACLFLPAEKPTAFRKQDILCDVASGTFTLTQNNANGVSGEFSFLVSRRDAAPIQVSGHFKDVLPPKGLMTKGTQQ